RDHGYLLGPLDPDLCFSRAQSKRDSARRRRLGGARSEGSGRSSGSDARRPRCEQRTELVEVDGLGQMRIEAGRESLTLVMRADVPGQGDEEDLLLAEMPPEPLGDLVTVHIGQADVDQRDARATVERALDPRPPAVGDVPHVPAGLEELAETFPRVAVVLDDQDPRRR